jgi:aspartate/tyrosine/aromatic aminotransferase
MGYFQHIEKLPSDPILELMWEFKKDIRKEKIDLSVGIYYDEHLRADILPSIKQAEKTFLEEEKVKTYLPIDGESRFIEATKELVFGRDLCQTLAGHIYVAQAVGGTGALRVGAEFLARSLKAKIYLPTPTWENHTKVFTASGLVCDSYPYYDYVKNEIDFQKILDFFFLLEEGSIVLLHACCHNPTGSDFTQKQWQQLAELFMRKKHIAFFDMAYQGFGQGLDDDAYAVRLFANLGHQMFIAFSYSKICGLYAERVGALCFIGETTKEVEAVASQIKVLIRSNYSNPPKHGALIVATLFNHPHLKEKWKQELIYMQKRIVSMKETLAHHLMKASLHKDFSYLLSKKGMFCFSSLTPSQVIELREVYGIYMTKTGRINLTGLSDDNIDKVVKAILEIMQR